MGVPKRWIVSPGETTSRMENELAASNAKVRLAGGIMEWLYKEA